jgi:hypothetical protein
VNTYVRGTYTPQYTYYFDNQTYNDASAPGFNIDDYYAGYTDNTDVFGIGKYVNTTNGTQIRQSNFSSTGQFLFRIVFESDNEVASGPLDPTFNLQNITLEAGNHKFSFQGIMYCENNCDSIYDNIIIQIVGSQNDVYQRQVYNNSDFDKSINSGWEAKSFNFVMAKDDTVVVNEI